MRPSARLALLALATRSTLVRAVRMRLPVTVAAVVTTVAAILRIAWRRPPRGSQECHAGKIRAAGGWPAFAIVLYRAGC